MRQHRKVGKMRSQSSPDPIKTWLARLLCGEEPGAIPDEAKLLATAKTEGVLALCQYYLRRTSAWNLCSTTLRTALTQAVYSEVGLEMVRAEELRKVLTALAQQNLPVLILKGAALAYSLYPEPHLRSRCDTDLLLSCRQEAEQALDSLRSLEYQPSHTIPDNLVCYEIGCYKTSPRGLNNFLDVHWRLSNSALFAERFTFSELAATAVPIPSLGPHAYGLAPTLALLLACIHRITNLWSGNADRLIWTYDIHLLATGCSDAQWQQIAQVAEERKICGPCLDGLQIAKSLFGTKLPGDIEYRFQVSSEKERWNYNWLAFRSLPSKKMFIYWIFRYLFPGIHYMRIKYNFHNPFFLPWFYGLRLVQGVVKEISLRRITLNNQKRYRESVLKNYESKP